MGKLAFFLPTNACHSDISDKAIRQADKEHLGLEVIAATGVPVATSCQAMDYELYPWLADTLKSSPSIEVIRSPYSHSLLPMLHNSQQRWEVQNGLQPGDNHPVMFFPEFYIPEAPSIISEAFLVLGPHTETYSYVYSPSCKNDGVTTWKLFEDVDTAAAHSAISYGGKTGLVMRGFDDILRTFYAFQADPGGMVSNGTCTKLRAAVDAVEQVVCRTSSDTVTIVPIDLEAPYVGSVCGSDIWSKYFQAIADRGLRDSCITLREAYERLQLQAERTRRPHRELAQKWRGYEAQWKYSSSFPTLMAKGDTKRNILISLATSSDVLSGMYRRIVSKNVNRFSLYARDESGEGQTLNCNGDNGIIEIGHAACSALRSGNSFKEELNKLESVSNTLLVERIIALADKEDL